MIRRHCWDSRMAATVRPAQKPPIQPKRPTRTVVPKATPEQSPEPTRKRSSRRSSATAQTMRSELDPKACSQVALLPSDTSHRLYNYCIITNI